MTTPPRRPRAVCRTCKHARKCMLTHDGFSHTGHGIEGDSYCHVQKPGKKHCGCDKFVPAPKVRGRGKR